MMTTNFTTTATMKFQLVLGDQRNTQHYNNYKFFVKKIHVACFSLNQWLNPAGVSINIISIEHIFQKPILGLNN